MLEHNQGNTAKAQRLYEQVIEIDGSCDKACEMLAFIHFPSKQSKQYALESFNINGRFNVFIDFFIAMLEKDNKLEKLSEIVESYPDYM